MRILHVEDSDLDYEIIADVLGDSVELLRATKLRDVRDTDCDVALLDLNLPETIGVETVERFRRGFPHLPVVVMTSMRDDKLMSACIQAGAHAVLSKENLQAEDLLKAIHQAALTMRREAGVSNRIVEHLRGIEQEIQHLLKIVQG